MDSQRQRPDPNENYILLEGGIAIANLNGIDRAKREGSRDAAARNAKTLFHVARLTHKRDLTRDEMESSLLEVAPSLTTTLEDCPPPKTSSQRKMADVIPGIATNLLKNMKDRRTAANIVGSVVELLDGFNPLSFPVSPLPFYACRDREGCDCRSRASTMEHYWNGDAAPPSVRTRSFEPLLFCLGNVGHLSRGPNGDTVITRVNLRRLFLTSIARDASCSQNIATDLLNERGGKFDAALWCAVSELSFESVAILLHAYTALLVVPKTSARVLDLVKNIVRVTMVHVIRNAVEVWYHFGRDEATPPVDDEAMEVDQENGGETPSFDGVEKFGQLVNLLTTYAFFFAPCLAAHRLRVEGIDAVPSLVSQRWVLDASEASSSEAREERARRVSAMVEKGRDMSKQIGNEKKGSRLREKRNCFYYQVLGEIVNETAVTPRPFHRRTVPVNGLPFLEIVAPELRASLGSQTKVPALFEHGKNSSDHEPTGNFLGWYVGIAQQEFARFKNDHSAESSRVAFAVLRHVHKSRTLSVSLLRESYFSYNTAPTAGPNRVRASEMLNSLNWQTPSMDAPLLSPINAAHVELCLSNEPLCEAVTLFIFFEQVINIVVFSSFYDSITSGDLTVDDESELSVNTVREQFKTCYRKVVAKYTNETVLSSVEYAVLLNLYGGVKEVVEKYDESPQSLTLFEKELNAYQDMISGMLKSLKLLFQS